MKTSSYDEEIAEDIEPTDCETVTNKINTEDHEVLKTMESFTEATVPINELIETEDETMREAQYVDCSVDLSSPEEIVVQKVEVCTPPHNSERWSDTTSQFSPPGPVDDVETVTSDTEPVLAQCEPTSEMYFTASSEVSLISDMEIPERAQEEEKETKDDRKECVIAGHVAAMRERFESMTRTNTPCPDLVRSLSPSLEVFRNTSPSPDRLP